MKQRKRFDWQAIHGELDRRLAEVGHTIEDDKARAHELLLARSRALAAVPRDGRAGRELTRLISCRLGRERYALPLSCVREVVIMSRCATIPGAGPGVVGIINWRGEFVVVFDPAPMLGVALDEDRGARRVIVLRGGDPLMAVAVDGVDEVIRADLDALEPVADPRSGRNDRLRGATAEGVLVVADDVLRQRFLEELQAA